MQFPIQDINGESSEIEVNEGQILFVAGKNGSGKSTLILNWAMGRPDHPVLSGNREVSFNSPAVSLSPEQVNAYQVDSQSFLSSRTSRTKRASHNNQDWLKGLISRLDALGNQCTRNENAAHRANRKAEANKIRELDPIFQINEIFHTIGFNLTLDVNDKSHYLVTKKDVASTYGIDQMSDGERAALILIGIALLSEPGQVITVDEPERHMHRSISSPLLRELFRRRPDLIWIVATHDVALLRDFADAKLLVLYAFNGTSWQFDALDTTHDLPEDVVDAIYGARERVLFIEGQEGRSLDEPLYQVLFPNTTIKSRGSCNEVKRAVEALNSLGALNSMKAKGIIDRDNEASSRSLTDAGIAKLQVYAVESLYFHPEVVTAIALSQGKEASVEALLAEACSLVTDESISRAAADCAERALRSHFEANPPRFAKIKESAGIFQIDLERLRSIEATHLREITLARDSANWGQLTKLIKIKSTQAPKLIMDGLGLTKSGYYGQARRAIATSVQLKQVILQLVPNPFEETNS